MSDQVWLRILHGQLVNICEEMGLAMMRTSYSPIFSEGLDFSTMILDPAGNLVAMQNINPAMLGQALYSGRWVIEDLGAEAFEPGDVVVHNDPYRGGSHMPEHLLIAPFFHEGELRGWVCAVGHVAEIGGMAPGSFAANATEIYQEGLRLPAGEAHARRRAGARRVADHARQPPHAGELVGRLQRHDRRAAGRRPAADRPSSRSTARAGSSRPSRRSTTTPRRGSGATSTRFPTACTRARTARRTTASPSARTSSAPTSRSAATA